MAKTSSILPLLKMFDEFGCYLTVSEFYRLSQKDKKLIGLEKDKYYGDLRAKASERVFDDTIYVLRSDLKDDREYSEIRRRVDSLRSKGFRVSLIPHSSYLRAILGKGPRHGKDRKYEELEKIIEEALREKKSTGKMPNKRDLGSGKMSSDIRLWMIKRGVEVREEKDRQSSQKERTQERYSSPKKEKIDRYSNMINQVRDVVSQLNESLDEIKKLLELEQMGNKVVR